MVVLVPTAVTTLDPRLATDAASVRVCRLIYRSLVDFDPGYRPEGQLADWSQLSPVQYRFSLRAGRAGFHDGTAVQAGDVAATYQALLDPGLASPLSAALAGIERIETPDGETVDFHLRAPDPLFPGRLTVGILPARLANRPPLGPQDVVGSGPFALLASEVGGGLQLRRRRDGVEVRLRPLREAVTRLQSLANGEADIVQGDLPPEHLGWVETQPGLTILRTPGDSLSYIGFNLRDPQLREPRLRQAIAFGVDGAALARHLWRGFATPATGLFTRRHWASAALPPRTASRPAASALLRELGIDSGHPLSLGFKTSANPDRLRLATAIQAELKGLGILLKVESLEWGAFYADIRAGRFQLHGLQWVGLKLPDVFRYAYHSESTPPTGANRGHFNDPEVDRLIEAAEAAPDLRTAAAAYGSLQRRLADTLPQLPLWFEDAVAVVGPRIAHYPIAADGSLDGLDAPGLLQK